MEDEIPVVIQRLKAKPDIYNLGILLTFQTGLRVGELSTLKKEDLHGRIIKIRRTEDKYRDKNNKWIVAVKEHAKTDAGNRFNHILYRTGYVESNIETEYIGNIFI